MATIELSQKEATFLVALLEAGQANRIATASSRAFLPTVAVA
jgi:hypothetical protein